MNQTQQLIPFSLEYSAELFQLTDKNRAFLRQWLPWLDYVQNVKDSENFIEKNIISDREGKTLNYFIVSAEKIIGTIGLREINPQSAEVGYWIAEDFQGKGIVSTALIEIIKQVREKNLTKSIILRCNPNNKASAKVANKCGFTYSHHLPESENLYGQWHGLDVHIKNL